MGIPQYMLDDIIKPLWRVSKTEWKGVALGVLCPVVLFFILWYWVLKPRLDAYQDYGTLVGSYTVEKGSDITVAAEELKLQFTNQIRERDYTKDSVDSVFVFPVFYFWSPITSLGRDAGPHATFAVGRRFSVATKYFYYTLRLHDLQIDSSDTTAVFDVYRRDIPASK